MIAKKVMQRCEEQSLFRRETVNPDPQLLDMLSSVMRDSPSEGR
jgi:hypothetical protein